MGLYSSDIDYEKGTRTTICRRAQLKLSASSRWQDLSVTRLCHLKCFCQLKRLRQLKCVWRSVRTSARSRVFSHTQAAAAAKTFLDIGNSIPLKQQWGSATPPWQTWIALVLQDTLAYSSIAYSRIL